MILVGNTKSGSYASGTSFTVPENQAGDVLIAGVVISVNNAAALGTVLPLVRLQGVANPQSEVAAGVITDPVASVSWATSSTGVAWAIVLRPDSGKALRVGAHAKSTVGTTTLITYPGLTLDAEIGEESRIVSVGMRRGGTAILGNLATATPNSSINILSQTYFNSSAVGVHWSGVVASWAEDVVDVAGDSGVNTDKYGVVVEVIESVVAQPATRKLIGLAASGF